MDDSKELLLKESDLSKVRPRKNGFKMIWPYIIHFRSKIIANLIILAVLLYLWFYLLNNSREMRHISEIKEDHDRHPQTYVNFKYLLIAGILAAEKGGEQVVLARKNLTIGTKGKTKEGVDDVLTSADKKSNGVMINILLDAFPGIKLISEETAFDPMFTPPKLTFPGHLFISNEFVNIPEDIEFNLDELVVWIDPLDATKEYSEGLTHFVTTMVCVVRKNEPLIGIIHQPFLSKTYWATKFGIDKKLLRSKFPPNENDDKKNSSVRIIISRSHKGDIEQWLHGSWLSKTVNYSLIEAAGSGFKTLQLIENNADIYLHKTNIKKWDICAPSAILRYGSNGGLMTTLRGESIDFSFDSNAVNHDGVFATSKAHLVKFRDLI